MIKIANDYYYCQVLCFNERCHANLGNGCQKTNDGQNDLFSMVGGHVIHWHGGKMGDIIIIAKLMKN